VSNIVQQYRDQLEDVKKNSQKIKDQIKLEDDKIKLLKDEIDASKKALGAAQAQGVNPIEINKEEGRIQQLERDLSNTESSRKKLDSFDVNKEVKDLRESARKKIAEERNSSATLTTAVSANAQRGLTNPITPRVVDPKAPKQGMDLGVIFAVQGAMSALTGATAGSTNGLAKFTNALSEGIGNFVTAAFAIQGITAMGGAAGAVASTIGPYGLAIAGITAAYASTAKYLDEVNGINAAAAKNIAKMSDAAQNAAFNLSKLPQLAQQGIKVSASNLIAGAATYPGYQSEFKFKDKKVDFEGSDLLTAGELEKSLNSVAESALGAGVSYDAMFNKIRDKSGDGKLTVEEVAALTDEFIKLQITSDQLKDATRNLDLSPKSTYSKALQELKPDEIEKMLAEATSGSAIKDNTLFGQFQRAMEATMTEEQRNATDFNSDAFKSQFKELQKSAKDQKAAAKDAAAEAEKSYRVNIGKIKAESVLESKLASIRNRAAAFEITRLEVINSLENDRLLTNDERAKKIAEANTGFDTSIKALETQQEKIKNIEQALIDSVSGIVGIDQDEIATTVAKIGSNLPTFNAGDIDGYLTSLQQALEKSGVIDENHKAIVQALLSAEIVNNGLNTQQQEALKAATAKLGIELKTIDVTRKRAIEEARINSMMENAKSLATFDLEKKSLNVSYEILSVNQEIEKVKRDTSLNELEKAKEVFKLEEKRVGLEKGKISIDYDKAATDAARTFQDRVLSIAKDQFGIAPRTISGSLSGGPEAVINAARAKISDPTEVKEFENLIKNQRSDYERDVELAERRRDLDKSGIGPVLEAEVQRRAREGFSGGMNDGINKLQDSINTFAFDIGEKIPQMFSDNMSNAINKMIEGGESFGNILQGAAYEFVKGINQANIKNLSDKFSNFLFGSDEATGKSNIMSMLGFASGGKVTGGSGSKDDVPAMLMGGEYVINKNAVRKYGPQFFDSINKGQLSGFAEGGKVPKQRGPQGNFYTPGTYDTGAIEGKRNLLDFATQSGTSGQFDRIVNMQGYQSISLEPESSRLTVAGMRNSPAFEATQSAKQQAFDLYLQQYQQEQEAKRAEKEQKKAFRNQLIMMAGTAALGGIGKAAMAGGKAAVGNLAKDANFLQKAGTFTKGMFTGGTIDSQNVGGLKNLFSGIGSMATGNFKGGMNQIKLSQIGTAEQYLKAIENPKFAGYLGVSQRASIVPEFDLSQTNLAGSELDEAKLLSLQTSGAESYIEPSLSKSYSSSGWLKNLFSSFKKPSFIPKIGGFTSGPFDSQGNYVEEWADDPSKWNIPQRATGGMIPSTSGIDTVPAMLSGGEFIMNRAAVQNIGAGNLQSMNSGTQSVLTDEASKEMNEKLLSKLDELIEVSSGGGDITINVSGSGNETTAGDNNQDASSVKQQLAREVKDAVLKVLDEQKRLGGRLRR